MKQPPENLREAVLWLVENYFCVDNLRPNGLSICKESDSSYYVEDYGTEDNDEVVFSENFFSLTDAVDFYLSKIEINDQHIS